MKKDIHPDVRRDPGHLHLWQHVHDAEHRHHRLHPRRRVLAVPPVLHRQAEDPRHRRPRRPLRGPLRQEASRDSSPRPAPVPAHRGWPAPFVLSSRHHPSRSPVFDAVEGLVAEHADLESKLAAPETHADQRLAKQLNQRYAELTAIVRDLAGVAAARRRHRGRARARLRGPRRSPRRRTTSPSGATSSRSGCATCWCRATPPTPRTRCSRSSRGRAARSRRCSPATCCGCTPATPRAAAGASRSSTPPSPTWAATSP